MTRLLLLTAMPCALFAQSIEGTWQGTLMPPNRNEGIRLVFRIAWDGNNYQGTFYNLTNQRQLSLGAVTLRGSTVSIAISGNGMNYEGKLEADGNSITGMLNSGANRQPLPLQRATRAIAWELPAPIAGAPLAAIGKAEFEVATIKTSPESRPGNGGFNVTATQLLSRNTSVQDIIAFAFEIHATQVSGLPGWAKSEKYDIAAKLPQGAGEPSDAQIRAMLKHLLRIRFGFAAHIEKRELTVYAITLGKDGPAGIKMAKSKTNATRIGAQGLGRMTASGFTMAGFAAQMQFRVLDRPVVDQTGLTDRYDFTLNWEPDEFQFPSLTAVQREYWASKARADGLPDLFTAFQQQLGLKLIATKAAVDVVVIDRVSRPSEN
jgi:uncharacterized protein (TIGR03435 family)